MDPLIAATPIPKTPAEIAQAAEREEGKRATFKKHMLEVYRVLLKQPEGKQAIKVDSQGEPLWDDAIHGQYTVLVARLEKGDGLKELETL